MKNTILILTSFLLLFLVFSCEEMEQVVQIELPPIESELVVECYLEAGKPYRLFLTETKGYFEDLDDCPFVRKAIVVITHNGVKDTLDEAYFINDDCDPDYFIPYGFIPFISGDSTRFYNYGSNTICPLDYTQPFTVEVWDTINNRYATATTQMIPPVEITTFRTEYNNSAEAYCLFGCQDDPNTTNYYRMLLHEKSLTKKGDGPFPLPVARNPEFDRVVGDQGIFGGTDVLHGTGYDYKQGDTLIGTLYHIDGPFYEYLRSSKNAQSSNGNPFGQSAVVISNVQGGEGIFTFLSYKRDTLIVP